MAVVLEGTLALNGLLKHAGMALPEDKKQGDVASLKQLRLERVAVATDGAEEPASAYFDSARWPIVAEEIAVKVIWTEESGAEHRQRLETDLAFAGTNTRHGPSEAYPILTRSHTLTRDLLETLLCVAHDGVDGSPDAWELEQARSAAKATTDIVWHGHQGRLAAVERLIRNRVLECLPIATRHGGPLVVTLYAGGAIDVESAEGVETDGGAVHAEPSDPRQTRERHNRLHYEQTAFCGHRGMEIGTRVAPNTGLWNHMLSRARRESGERLWEPDSKIEGTLMKLVPGGEEDVAAIIAPGATHAVAWHTAASRWEGRHEAVHLLDPHELEQVRNRVTGPLLASAIEHARDGEHEDNEPLARAAAEYSARGTLPGSPAQS